MVRKAAPGAELFLVPGLSQILRDTLKGFILLILGKPRSCPLITTWRKGCSSGRQLLFCRRPGRFHICGSSSIASSTAFALPSRSPRGTRSGCRAGLFFLGLAALIAEPMFLDR